MCTPSRLSAPPAHFTQRQSSRRAWGDYQARWAGARGGEGSELEVLEWRWRVLGLEDPYQTAGNGKRGAVCGGRERRTWDGGGACGGTRWSGSGGGGGWGWWTRIGGAGIGRCGAVRGGRGAWTWDSGGVCAGARVSGDGGVGALGVHGGASGGGSGASERVRRGIAAGSVSVGGGSVPRRGSRSAAFCGIGPRRRRSQASQEASVGPGGPRVVPPGTGGGKKSPTLHGSAA